jgi:hypothetical protein
VTDLLNADLRLTLSVLVAARRERLEGERKNHCLHSDAQMSGSRTASPDADGLQVHEGPDAA